MLSQKSSFMTQLHTRISNAFMSTNYTVACGEDMKNAVITLPSGIRAVIYNTDLFIMDGRVTHDDVCHIMDNIIDKVENVIVFCYDKASNKYVTNAGHLSELVTLVRSDIRSTEITVYTLDEFTCYGCAGNVTTMQPSGYVGRTNSHNSIFNMTVTVCGVPYIITIILNDFVAKNISMPILDIARDHIKAVYGARYDILTEEDYEQSDGIVKKMKSIFGLKKEKPFDTLKNVINTNGSFLEALRKDENFAEAFAELSNKNILINMRVISKNDLPEFNLGDSN